jgi:hypothetical protein
MPGATPRLLQAAVFCFAVSVIGLVYLGCAWILRIPELDNALSHSVGRVQPLVSRWRRNPALGEE